MPVGKQLYWTGHPRGAGYIVVGVRPAKGGARSLVTLQLETGTRQDWPQVGEHATFSVFHLASPRFLRLPARPPWTHVGAMTGATTIEDGTAEGWNEAV